MRFATLLLTVIVAVSVVPFAPAAGEEYEAVTLMLPKGDPQKGRLAFGVLRCTACHRVEGEEGLPEPVAAQPGPVLGRQLAEQEAGEVATSIVAPSHVISEEVARRSEGRLSPMGDFTEVLTVRKLVDLVAFLQQLRQSDE